jgi:hypothetical protein
MATKRKQSNDKFAAIVVPIHRYLNQWNMTVARWDY